MGEWDKFLRAVRTELRPRSTGGEQPDGQVRPDKDNPRSEGYACRKGLNVAFHQHHSQPLTIP